MLVTGGKNQEGHGKLLNFNLISCCISQTKTNITKMESFQRYKTTVEGQDQTKQRYMEMLAYAM